MPKDIVPQKIYFILGSQNTRIFDQKEQSDCMDDSSIYIPKGITLENTNVNNLLLAKNFKVSADTVYTVLEDEICPGFIKKKSGAHFDF